MHMEPVPIHSQQELFALDCSKYMPSQSMANKICLDSTDSKQTNAGWIRPEDPEFDTRSQSRCMTSNSWIEDLCRHGTILGSASLRTRLALREACTCKGRLRVRTNL
ncbi:hypothetical protein PGT21_017692 [Puccinia graminis f. sp. tritici]|uniref:Uncharacterized protein n=1 Tax=Puccinia graminis f. sp. tritici TaxID=56615 RepID=A0A5B0PP30_PUCGR|nr:hypothetical protein PGT21_017692 [Puccinia graminis f. sp. tritici]